MSLIFIICLFVFCAFLEMSETTIIGFNKGKFVYEYGENKTAKK